MLYPLKFDPHYVTKIWGGRTMEEKYRRALPPGLIGEAWEISDHPHGLSYVVNGPLAGSTLGVLIEKYGVSFYGSNPGSILPGRRFPLLVKTIDAKDKLSVQVHPDDAYALRVENESGKTEMWYVLDAKPGAELVLGIKPGSTKDMLSKAVHGGYCEELLHSVSASPGDVFHIPAGMVHAMGAGVLIAEFQQNSDTVYRLYDYNRTDDKGSLRPLHVEKALEVAVFSHGLYGGNTPLLYKEEASYRIKILDACEYFVVEEWSINPEFASSLDGSHFVCLYTVEGGGEIQARAAGPVHFEANDCLMLPASLGDFFIYGHARLLASYVPESLGAYLRNLEEKGFRKDQLAKIRGPALKSINQS